MRWPWVGTVVLSVTATTGCPSEFGKEGRVEKAVQKDAQQQLLMLRQCTDSVRERVCASGKENSRECLECGGPP